MVVELKLCKTDNRKFGFRLVGGADFETPLTVSMVMDGSVAEEAGMRVGDVVVRINDIPTTPLSHQEAHEVLTKAGNNFCVGVLRERDLTPCGASPCPTTASDPLDFADDYRNEVLSFPTDPSLITDDHIAEMMSGEAEVLKDHNVIGVNFNKLIPTAGVFKQSEVFQTINEEMRKSKQEQEEEEKRWTTFLQKPQRPVPKQAYKYNVMPQTYRPKIVRQSKPKIAPEIIQQEEQLRSPSPMRAFPVHIPLAHETASPEPRFPTEDETKPATPVPEIKIETPEPEPVPEPEPSPQITEAKKEETENKEESEEFVKQLAQVQQQLEALSNLPTTIQATLDSITHQLHSLLNPPIAEIKVPRKVETPPKEEVPEPEPEKEPTPPPAEEKYDIPEDANAEHLGPHSEQEFEKIQKEVDKHEEDWEDKFEKKPAEVEENFNISDDPKANLQAELKQKLKPKAERRLKSAFGPLTPQQRPIFLKGRMWKRPEDAYNEDFIAEVISSQAELIKGSTLGNTYESTSLGYDARVNFLKYQKPEKDISFIKNSETYRLIHGLDNQPSCGISNRPEIVAAEADIKRCATPCQ